MHYLILFSSILVTLFFCVASPGKYWLRAILARKNDSAVILICFVLPFLGSSQGANTESIVQDHTRVFRIILVSFLLMYGVFFSAIKFRRFQAIGIAVKYYFLYALFALASALYSSDPLLTTWKALEIFAILLALITVLGKYSSLSDIEWGLNVICFLLLFIVVSGLVGGLLAPNEAFHDFDVASGSMVFALRGVCPELNANSLTQMGALLSSILVISFLYKKHPAGSIGYWLALGVAVVVTILGHSRTSILAGVLGMLFVLVIGRHWIFVMSLGALSALIAVFVGGGLLSEYIYRGQSAKVFTSLSGRTVFWEKVWNSFLESPILGKGFYAGHRNEFMTSSVDNSHLEVLIDLGVVGYSLFLLPLVIGWVLALKGLPVRSDFRGRGVWMALFIAFFILTIRSLTGPSFQVMHVNLPLYLFLLFSFYLMYRLKRENRNRLPAAQVAQQSKSKLLLRRYGA